MKTPTGQFRVAEKIGGEMPGETVFRNRVALGPGDPLAWTSITPIHGIGLSTFTAQNMRTKSAIQPATGAFECEIVMS